MNFNFETYQALLDIRERIEEQTRQAELLKAANTTYALCKAADYPLDEADNELAETAETDVDTVNLVKIIDLIILDNQAKIAGLNAEISEQKQAAGRLEKELGLTENQTVELVKKEAN